MAFTRRTPEEVLSLVKKEGVEIIDFRFCDLPGLMQHFSVPAHELTDGVFEDGLGFDGSSIRGFQEIQESDMLLMPDPDTAVIDPFRQHKTLNLNCFVRDPVTGESYSARPPLRRQEGGGLPDLDRAGRHGLFRPEAEFFIFDDIRFDQNSHEGYYHIDSVEGIWNSGSDEGPNLGFKPRHKEGYFPIPPMDHFQDLRSEMILTMEQMGIEIEVQHHEVGTAGQAEIDMRFDTLLTMADKLMLYKYVVKSVARANGYTATFMPKPLFGDNGSGMHVHSSLWSGGEPLFYSELGYAGLSDMARWYIGGLLSTPRPYWRSPRRRPTATSAWSPATRRRSTWCTPSATARLRAGSRCTPRAPRPSGWSSVAQTPPCNPYLAFSAILMAGLDGVLNKTEPPDPVDKDLYDLPPEELALVPQVPGSLQESLAALEADHEFLQAGGVFTDDLIETWLEYKRIHEIDPVRLRPHPWEFYLYYDI